jgi:hypothetical protein
MSTDVEARLRAALTARADLVGPEDLTPLAPVVELRPRWQSPWVLLATAAVVLLVLGVVLQGFRGQERSDRIAPKPDDRVELQLPTDVGRDWKADEYSTPRRLDLDGDGTKEEVTFLSEETKSGAGRARIEATLSSTGEETYGVVDLSSNVVVSSLPPIDADDDGDQELVLYDGDITGPESPLHPIVLDLRDGLLVEAVVEQPELLQMGNVPVPGSATASYELVRSHGYEVRRGTLYSSRSVSSFASTGMTVTRPEELVLDTWRWVLDDDGVLRPVEDGCVLELITGEWEPCAEGARDALPALSRPATGTFGVGEQFSWTEGYQYDARLEAGADPVLVVEGADGRTINHPLEVADPVVSTTQPTSIFYDGASFVVGSASDPAYVQVLWQDADRLRVLQPVGEVPLTNDDTHRTWLTEEGRLWTVEAGDDGTWQAWSWTMATRSEMTALPAGTVCFDDVDDPTTARDC